MSKPVKVISEELVFNKGIFQVKEAHLSHYRYDGQMSSELVRLSFERGDSIAAILHDPYTDAVILVEQFRYPTLQKGPGWLLELPAGIIDTAHDSNEEITVRRELMEEIGYQIGSLKKVLTFYVSPGGSSERVSLYFGEITPENQVKQGGGLAGEGEDIRTLIIPLVEAFDKIETGEIIDAKTIIGLQWLKFEKSSI